MKITNNSARLYYIAGKKIAPGQTAVVDDAWKENKTVIASMAKGEIRFAAEDEAVTAEEVEKKTKGGK
ncbi:hypothetical protein P88_00100 [Erwinia phage phiEt88]|uniref:hypothetical protein n=1 Tax=Erwinia phage phiEt88 TaxID=925984 RepID=UPI0001F1FC5A|nr:hypothetical protein ErPhphiEt88_gp10 [Erwinia phage phiEt88]CBX44521.1 hypothetical protein P88_00100 [Erwinia phage phiEt88]